MINQNFIFLAATLNLIGSSTYIISTLQGRTKPNRVSFLMWALAPMISFAAMVSNGVGISSLMTFMVGFGPLMILLASFVNKKAYWEITRFDVTCGIISFIGLILWLLTRTGALAVLFSILADGMAALPTVRKAYIDPDSENFVIFVLGSISAVITMLTLPSWTFIAYGFPLYICLICLTIVGAGILGKRNKRHKLG